MRRNLAENGVALTALVAPRVLRLYGLAVATTIVATALTLAVRPLLHTTPSPPFIISVLLTAWLGGIGPALLATLLAAVSLDLVQASRLQALSLNDEAITRLVVFVIVAVAVGALAAAQRRAERTAHIARAQAEAANRQKDEFVSMLAHELRTPLTVVLSAANAVAERRLDPDGTARALAAIQRNTRLQARLIGDLVDLARLGHGKVLLDKRAVNLREIVEAAAEDVSTTVRARDLKIAVEADPGCPSVTGDPARLEQIISNLLSNAVGHSRNGAMVSVRIDTIDRWARIDVEDEGSGIPPELLAHVFEPYRQDTPGTGLGLGLAIVRELVDLHGGYVEAHSAGIGRGARFTVMLPTDAGVDRAGSGNPLTGLRAESTTRQGR